MRRIIFAVPLLAALASGCQQSGEPSAAPPAAHHGQRLITATISDPKTFNPLIAVDASSAGATDELFDGLVRLNARTLEPEPVLAERWEYNADGTVCTFHLRHDVHWHDGQAFTAADVVFTFDAIFDEHVPNSVKHVLTVDGQRIKAEAVDDYTVRLILPRPFAPLLNALPQIYPKHVLGASLKDGTFVQQWAINTPPEKLIGTGPYRMVRYVQAQFLEYRRNPDYWRKDNAGKPLPYLEGQTQLIVPNQDTLYLKFVAGQTDVHNARPEEISELRAKQDDLKITVQETGLETGSTFVAFNRNSRHYIKDNKKDPRISWFTDMHFLQAIAHAIDKESMVRNCLNGFGKPGVAEVSPENNLYHNPNLTDYKYDLDEARRLLKEGGYVLDNGTLKDRAGNPIEFALTTNAGNQIREKMCSILKEDWTKLGMKVNYRPLDFQALVEKLYNTYEWDAVLIGFTGGGPEPNNSANLLRSNANLHFWNPNQEKPETLWEAEIDQLLEQGTRELDVKKRQRIYWRIQEILHEQLPMIQTVRQQTFIAYKTILQNFEPTVWGLYRPELIRIAE